MRKGGRKELDKTHKNLYYTLTSQNKGRDNEIAQGFLQEKKSKFFSYLFSITEEEEAKNYIEQIKWQNKEARHVIYLYSYRKENHIHIRFSDDGEPQGTGTRGIYELLQKENLTNICIVIVRYFGGILLGTGLLARTYLSVAKEAIHKCQKEEIHEYETFLITTTYADYESIKYLCEHTFDYPVKILKMDFHEEVVMELMIEKTQLEDFHKQIKKKIQSIKTKHG